MFLMKSPLEFSELVAIASFDCKEDPPMDIVGGVQPGIESAEDCRCGSNTTSSQELFNIMLGSLQVITLQFC